MLLLICFFTPINGQPKEIDLFFIRHVESKFNARKFNWMPDSAVSTEIGTAQVNAIYQQLGKESSAFWDVLNEESAQGLTFISSNLRRAQITAIAARQSLLREKPKDQKLEKADFIVTSLIQEHAGVRHKFPTDARSLFPQKIKADLEHHGREWYEYLHGGMDADSQAQVWQKLMGDEPQENALVTFAPKARYIGTAGAATFGFDTFNPRKRGSSKDHNQQAVIRTKDKLDAYKDVELLKDVQELLMKASKDAWKNHKKPVFLMAGHSGWFQQFVSDYGNKYVNKPLNIKEGDAPITSKWEKIRVYSNQEWKPVGGGKPLTGSKLDNGQMVHVKLHIYEKDFKWKKTRKEGDKEIEFEELAVSGGSMIIDSITPVFKPDMDALKKSAKAHLSISNLLLREEEKEYEMATLRAAANRQKRRERDLRRNWN